MDAQAVGEAHPRGQRPTHQQGRGVDQVAAPGKEVVADTLARRQRPLRQHEFFISAVEHHLAVVDRLARAAVGDVGGHLPGQLVGGPDIVGIEEGHQLAPRRVDTGVACRGAAAVHLELHPAQQLPLLRRQVQLHRTGRGVVDHHDLQRCVVLRQHAVDGALQLRLPVEVGDDDADQRAGVLPRVHAFIPGPRAFNWRNSRRVG